MRALAACAHSDACALLLGETGFVTMLVKVVQNTKRDGPNEADASAGMIVKPETEASDDDVVQLPAALQRHIAMAFVNLSVHDDNKRRILDAGGVEALVRLQGSSDQEVRDTAAKALEILADVPADSELAAKKQNFGIDNMVEMLRADNPLIQGMAAEALAEEVWNDPSKQQQIMDKKGAEALLEAIEANNDKDTLLPSLWALRNLAYNNDTTKTKIGKRQGIEKLVTVCNDQVCDVLFSVQCNVLEQVVSHITLISVHLHSLLPLQFATGPKGSRITGSRAFDTSQCLCRPRPQLPSFACSRSRYARGACRGRCCGPRSKPTARAETRWR